MDRALVGDALRVEDGSAVLDRSWWSWAGPHGGLLAGLALRGAAPLAGGGRSPRALTVQFLRPAAAGPVTVAAELLREGGASSTVASTLSGPDGVVLTATVTSGRARGGGAPWAGVPAPAVPAPQDCPPLEMPADMVPFSQHLDYRPADGRTPLGEVGTPCLVSWVRLRSGEPADAAALTVLADAMPPALYGATTVPVPVPTVELSVLYASGLDEDPVEGWLLTRIATRSAADGWCVDDSEVWAADGRLLVQARQTRRVLGELVR